VSQIVAAPTRLSPARATPFVVGLTGPIGAGKSTVARLLEERGATVIDADAVYASLVQPGQPLLRRIAEEFGPHVLRADGSLDRRALGDLVFGDQAALTRLDRLTHPAVIAEIERQIGNATTDVVVIEAIKLVQSGLAQRGDAIWLVTADPGVRARRLMERDGLDAASATKRVAAAIDPTLDAAIPMVVIDNSGDQADLRQRVDAAWQTVEKQVAVKQESKHVTDEGENR
jgi:dephospho-CoA kinase